MIGSSAVDPAELSGETDTTFLVSRLSSSWISATKKTKKSYPILIKIICSDKYLLWLTREPRLHHVYKQKGSDKSCLSITGRRTPQRILSIIRWTKGRSAWTWVPHSLNAMLTDSIISSDLFWRLCCAFRLKARPSSDFDRLSLISSK